MPTKHSKINKKGMVRLPDTMVDNDNKQIDIIYGSNFGIVVIVDSNKSLDKDNTERIRILTDVKR
jgi:hypothetical protein